MRDGKKWILVADDEREIREVLALMLKAEGYEVTTAEDGRSVVEQMSNDIDLYLLDINMPEMSGIMAASEIRKLYETPIVFLTAYSGEADKIMGFSVGADDYIVKPFSNMELIMRIRAILRRSAIQNNGIYSSAGGSPTTKSSEIAGESIDERSDRRITFGDLILDLDRQAVMRGDELISLTYTEFKILELLVTHKKKIYSLENIYQSIWDDDVVGDSSIMVHIKNIRKKIGDNSRNPVYIKTAWGRGYYVE